MIRAVRQSYYNDPESDRWPVPKLLCVVDGGKEFSQPFRTGFAAELGPQVEVKWQTVPAGNPNAQDTLTVVYANLGDRDDIEEVKFDTTRWANGTVQRYNAGQQGRPGSINVDFDDG
jgi:hypothetical protein